MLSALNMFLHGRLQILYMYNERHDFSEQSNYLRDKTTNYFEHLAELVFLYSPMMANGLNDNVK